MIEAHLIIIHHSYGHKKSKQETDYKAVENFFKARLIEKSWRDTIDTDFHFKEPPYAKYGLVKAP